MSRPPRQSYRCEPLGELAGQAQFIPPMRRREQAMRAEQLHDEIAPQAEYPFDYLHYRITRFRSEAHGQHVLTGGDVLPDLRLLIDRLTRAAPIPITEDDPVRSVEALANDLDVSVRTIARWREVGLRWRWSLEVSTKRKLLTISNRALDAFFEANPDILPHANQYSRMSPLDRRRLIDRARKLARRGGFSLNQTAVLLATESGRGLETVRQLLAAHERDHPRRLLFPEDTPPLTARQHRVIARAGRMGMPINTLAQRFGRSPSTIRRVIHQQRASALRQLDLGHVDLPTFDRPDADAVILRPQPATLADSAERPQQYRATQSDKVDLPAELSELRELYDQRPLPADQTASLLVRMNYLLHKAAHTREALDARDPRVREMAVVERSFQEATQIRTQLVRAHLPVVLAVARRHWVSLPQTARTASLLADLLELGNGVLIEAVSRFDPSREQRFETYLNWALMRDFAAHAPEESRAQRRADGQATLARMRAAALAKGVKLGGS